MARQASISVPMPPTTRERLRLARNRRAVAGKIPSEAALAAAFIDEALGRDEKNAPVAAATAPGHVTSTKEIGR
jgi:hypothetical protein